MHAVSRVAARFLLSLFPCLLLPLAPLGRAQSLSATWARGRLSLNIPGHALHAGAGRLAVQLLDPAGKVLAEAERPADAAAGDIAWTQDLTIPSSLPFDDLVWERVRWRFWYDGDSAPALEQVRSVSTILRRPVMHILGQNTYIAGAQAAVRIVVSDSSGDGGSEAKTIDSGSVHVALLVPDSKPRVLYAGRLDRRGTAEADFRFPAGLTGHYDLRFTAQTPIGFAEMTESVRLEDKVSVLLTTEKPLYQPSQTIHMHSLALDRASGHAAAGRRLTFEMEDARGNKVFRKAATTDAFGIASAEFTLADEVNLGAWHLHALMGDSNSPVTAAELTLTVQRYVLPKFRVAIDFSAQNGKPKRDYRPGDHVTGIVHANYFFGKPVDHAAITVKAAGIDVAEFQAASTEGQTDASGDYRFDLRLPGYFAGSGLAQGASPVVVEATVKDAASHTETHDEQITVTRSPLLILAVPESGKLVPGIENQVYVLTSYPDGSPAQTDLRVRGAGMPDTKASTDAGGVAVVQLKPTGDRETLRVDADDRRGNRSSSSLPLESRMGDDQLLLRASRAVYKPGNRMDLSVFSTRRRGAAYIDLIRDGQTILTRDVDLANGHADLSIRVTPEMTGTLSIDAYIFGSNAGVVSDHRLVFVQPADDLHIEATADASSYLPGSEAQVHFCVTNARGEGVAAALGLEVVDEAVFALTEKQPGFAKVFFYLEQELMQPRYEIHSLSPENIVAPAGGDGPQQQDRDASVLFSAAETANPYTFDTEAGKEMPEESPDLVEQYRNSFVDYVESLAAKLSRDDHRNDGLQRRFAALTDDQGHKPRDAWGAELRLEPAGWSGGRDHYYRIRSAGPDREFYTGDDLTVFLEARSGTVFSNARGGSLTMRMEHDRGPMNGLAEIAGKVTDVSGAVIPDARVTVRSADGKTRRVVTNALGFFSLSALPAGKYDVRIAAPGFAIATRQVELAPQDRAVLAAVLQVGAITQSVAVVAEDAVAQRQGFVFKGAFGAVAQAAPMVAGPVVNGMLVGGLDRGLSVAKTSQKAHTSAEPHVRSYFPEALYINPEILTDGNGAATVTIPLADSITTWRMAMFASTAAGALGNAASSLKVFQDFFVDLDLPVTLTQGDRVSVPVAVYNYSGHRGDVTLSLQPADWFTVADDTAERTISVAAGQVGGAQFTIAVQHIGKFKLTLAARMHGPAERQDVVVREIEVVPNGRQQDIVFNGRLDSAVHHSIRFPPAAIPGAEKLFVRLYPGPLSQIVEGMDGILRMPYGCFEQTSSSTYPNVLALDYMKRNNKLTPEVRAKAEGFISNGYQRLLTFEVPGGGFSWFGHAPANKILTAYGLMEFEDMARVYDIDPRLIARTAQWLVSQQQGDGSWKPDTQFINEGATDRYNSDVLRITAYIAWALESAQDHDPAAAKAREYIGNHLDAKTDTYTLAVLANFAAGSDNNSDLTHRILRMLIDAHTENAGMAWWKSEETGIYGGGESASVETTGLAVQALLKTGQDPDLARKALAWLLSKKGADGNWGTTQATIMALRALVLASDRAAGDAHGDIAVLLNGKTVDTLAITAENNDLLQQFVLPVPEPSAEQNVEIRFSGTGGMAYQVVGRSFVPWPTASQHEALSIDVAYDRTTLPQNDIVTATATIHNNLRAAANMVMVDLGIPPGFDPLSEDLQTIVEKSADANRGRLEKFSLTATQAILYFNSLGPNQTVKLPFRLRAKYPIRAKTFESRVYEYYDPAVSATAAPVQFEVTQH